MYKNDFLPSVLNWTNIYWVVHYNTWVQFQEDFNLVWFVSVIVAPDCWFSLQYRVWLTSGYLWFLVCHNSQDVIFSITSLWVSLYLFLCLCVAMRWIQCKKEGSQTLSLVLQVHGGALYASESYIRYQILMPTTISIWFSNKMLYSVILLSLNYWLK